MSTVLKILYTLVLPVLSTAVTAYNEANADGKVTGHEWYAIGTVFLGTLLAVLQKNPWAGGDK